MAAPSRPRSVAHEQAIEQIRSFSRARLSQAQIARITGYSRRGVRDILSGRRGVSAAGALRVSESARELSGSADVIVNGKIVHFDYMTDAEKAVATGTTTRCGRPGRPATTLVWART